MRSSIVLLALLFAPACRKSEPTAAERQEPAPAKPTPSASTSSVASAPAPLPPKVASIDVTGKTKGVTHEMRNALVWAYEQSQILHVELSTHARTCADLDGEHMRVAPGEQIFEAELAPPLKPGGEWNVAAVFHTDAKGTASPVVASYGKATVPSNDPTQSVKVTFATAMTGDATLSGTAEARPCGRRKRSSPIPPKSEQKALSLEIDGQKVSVMGAKYEASREQVFLSSGGVTCGEDPIEELVDLRLSKEDLLLFGLSVNADELKFDDPPKFTVGKPANGSVDATFNVDAKVQGHRVKLTGKAKLNACE